MDTLLVSSSRSPRGNTNQIASTIAAVLNAPVMAPPLATPEALAVAERIGLGSGIYWMGFDHQLIARISDLPDMTGKDAFVFATSGLPEPPFLRYTHLLREMLENKGFRVIGMFTCRGASTWGPFGIAGGVSTDHPDHKDLVAARAFANLITP